MLEIVQFMPEHLAMITPRENEAREMDHCHNLFERASLYQALGPCFTGVIDGQILVSAGIIKLWEGVGELWAVTSSLVPHKPLTFHRAVKHGLHQLRLSMGLWRLQAVVHKDNGVGQRWIIKGLGFKYEGHSPGYGWDKSTYIRYGRFYED